MKSIEPFRFVAAMAVATFLALPLLAGAQSTSNLKGTPKLQPPPSQTSGLPSGQDQGTPLTSNSAPLGPTVLPTTQAERDAVKRETAASRAASRKRGSAPAPAASATSNVKPVDHAASAAARP